MATKKNSSPVKGTSKSSKKVTPLGDRVLLRALSDEEASKRSAFGIIIPDTVSKEKPQQGIVVAVGAGRIDDNGNLVPMTLKVGDRVVFSTYAPTEITLDGTDYFILDERSILAVIE